MSTAAQIQNLGEVKLFGPDGRPLDLSQSDRIGFSPGIPGAPVVGQRGYPPWEWERPVGWNLMWTPRGESTTKGTTKSFDELRSLAQWCTEARVAIEIQKKKLRGLSWTFVPEKDSLSKKDREAYTDKVEAARQWWRRPNKVDGLNFSAWLSQAVEEMYVTDALVFYKQRAFGGALDSLVQLDGATVKIDIDNFGHVLQYRQVLYGRPTSAYDPSDLAYVVFNPRVDQVYGTSPLEEIAPVIQTAIKRQLSHLSYYTEGNVPMATLGVPADWPVKRIKEIQEYLDASFSGDDRLRHKVRAIPMTPGNRSSGVLQQLRPFEFSPAEHEMLLKLIHVHLGVSASQVVAAAGLGGGGVASSQADEAADVGQRPLRKFLAEWITEVTQNDLGIDGVRFTWDDSSTANELSATQSRVLKVQAGLLTVDEARAEEGREPIPQAGAGDTSPTPLKSEQSALIQSVIRDVTDNKMSPDAAAQLILLSIPTLDENAVRSMVAPSEELKDEKKDEGVLPDGDEKASEPEADAAPSAEEPVEKSHDQERDSQGRFASMDNARESSLHQEAADDLDEQAIYEKDTAKKRELKDKAALHMMAREAHMRAAITGKKRDKDAARIATERASGKVDVAKANPYREPSGGRFASNDYPGGPVAEARLAALPDEQRVPVGIAEAPVHDVAAALVAMGNDELQRRLFLAEAEDVAVADLYAMRPTVARDRLKRFMEQPPSDEAVAVVRHGGRLFVHDGHHRVAAAVLRGVKEVPAKVVDLGDVRKYRGLAGVPEPALRSAIGKSLPAGDLTASPDRAEVEALLGPDDALVEFTGEGDRLVITGVDRDGDRLVVRGRVE